MRPVKIKTLPPWRGDVRTEVIGHVFYWTMDEVDEFLAQIAAERTPQAPEAERTLSEKRCPECGRLLSLESFYRRSVSPDGRQRLCKRCSQESTKTCLPTGRSGERVRSVSF